MEKDTDIIDSINACIRIAACLTVLALLIPVAALYKTVFPGRAFDIPLHFHRFLLRVIGITVRVSGVPSTAAPVLFVANHSSYLDIPVLGSLLHAGFVAKAEVSGWPLFGFLARMQNTIFVERRSTRAATQRAQLQNRLAKNQSLILFPEGTSSDGMTALHFKSSLFSIIEESSPGMTITVQPVSVTCTGLDGYPILREQRPLYAWYGDMTLPGHLWNVFKRGRFTVDVVFHPPLAIAEGMSRKMLASTCQALVAQGIERSRTGKNNII